MLRFKRCPACNYCSIITPIESVINTGRYLLYFVVKQIEPATSSDTSTTLECWCPYHVPEILRPQLVVALQSRLRGVAGFGGGVYL